MNFNLSFDAKNKFEKKNKIKKEIPKKWNLKIQCLLLTPLWFCRIHIIYDYNKTY